MRTNAVPKVGSGDAGAEITYDGRELRLQAD